jgi:glycosyltransferase involved in cell wall biosynthesis
MEPRRGRARIGAREIVRIVAHEAAERCLAERLREELAPASPRARMPSVTVAVCTRNRPESLARCLASLLALDPPPGDLTQGFEILVVDNAPPDDRTRRTVEAAPGVRYAMEPRPGLNFGRNRALGEARGDILAFVDDDVVVDRGWLAGLHEAWSENPDAKGFTGLVLPHALDTQAQILFELRGGFRRGLDKIRYRTARQDNQLFPCGAGIFGAGANMAFDRATLLRIGGFDDALDTGPPLPGGGDLDIFYRVARTGHPFVYEPQFAVFHEHRRDLPGLRRQYWTWGLAHMAFVMKAHAEDPAYRGRLRLLVLWWFRDQCRQLARSLLGRHVLPPGMVAAELWGGVVGLFGEYSRSRRRVQRIREAHP